MIICYDYPLYEFPYYYQQFKDSFFFFFINN